MLRENLTQGPTAKVKAGAPAYLLFLQRAFVGPVSSSPSLFKTEAPSGFQAEGSLNPALKTHL